jgi:hypothetical protein
MTEASDQLDDLTARLQDAAARLRAEDVTPEAAAALVDECARLAAEAGAELERQARAEGAGPAAGQGELL